MNIIIEGGLNHFGKVSEAKKIVRYFINSDFNNLTFMISENYVNEKFKKQYNFSTLLPDNFYNDSLKQIKKKKKKLGLAIYGENGVRLAKKYNFDFFKLLSIGISNKDALKFLSKTNKKTLISTGKSNDKIIKKALSFFKNRKKITLLHTPMTYNASEQYLKRISYFKKKFRTKIGFSNHYNSIDAILSSLSYQIDDLLIYLKPTRKKGRFYPDNSHAFYTDELSNLYDRILKNLSMHNFNSKSPNLFMDDPKKINY